MLQKKGGKREKKTTQGFGVNAAGSAGGVVQDPHLSKEGSLVSPPAAKPPAGERCPRAQAAPRCGFGGHPNQGLLSKNPPKKAEFGVLATALLCSGAGGQVGGRGGSRQGRTDGRMDGQTEMVRACKKSLLEREAGGGEETRGGLW